MPKQSKSSQRWLERQRRDPYVRGAAKAGLGSRAHFKLEQLDRRFGLLRAGMHVLELGAAPGGWTRYLAQAARGGFVLAVDRRPMDVPPGVTFLEQDIHAGDFVAGIDALLDGAGVDLVLSDMAPNITGIRAADQAATMALAELAADCAERWLNPGGNLVVKVLQGEGVDAWLSGLRRQYRRVALAKPDASRQQSKEIYGVALGRGTPR